MKKTLIILFAFIFANIFSQDIMLVDNDYTYTKIIDVSLDKKEIYMNLKKWLNNSSFKSKYTIDQDDPESGIISFNETLPEVDYVYMQSSQVSYKVNVEFKDKKIRFTVNNIIFNNSFAGLANMKRSYGDFIKDINLENQKYITNIESYDKEEKQRQKKKYEYEANNARNNLRSLNALKDLINNQIIINQELISKKASEKDDW